jgi:dTMP kinase
MIGVEPDLTVVIDMEPARALARSLGRLGSSRPAGEPAEDRFETFGLPFQEHIRRGFLDLAREAPARFVVINGDRPEDIVAQDVAAVAFARLEPA